MGLFDFLKRKPEKAPEDEGPSPHYVFAHYALRQIALAEPLQILAIVASPDVENFIDAVLQDVVEQCGREAGFEAADIKVHPKRVNDYPCVVVEMPEPQEAAEAHMVAILVPIDLSKDPPSEEEQEQIKAHYYTLEKSFSLTGEPRTVLAEWGESRHSNYGEGPEPTVEAFVAALNSRSSGG
ncbi:hypothetical protein Pan153_40640 [Gimesia panareensis]|uniref:Uncharacterized protein n=1 Tax=Gimesia panareensis TaxID=2527978 RepID=A0A518FST6_9PLAN|nr:hypothetical protein [Gimesia panareensis]QDV19399.1 hypothetical protein Pan153_40640 [Gimesia panareensis]